MISTDIINSLNNNVLTVLNLRCNQIDNIDVFKVLENNNTLTKLDLGCNQINNIDVFKILEKIVL